MTIHNYYMAVAQGQQYNVGENPVPAILIALLGETVSSSLGRMIYLFFTLFFFFFFRTCTVAESVITRASTVRCRCKM